jgi:hypothetical protein
LQERQEKEYAMSQPIRVEGWAYTPGAQVKLRLRFRSQKSFNRVKAEFGVWPRYV